MAEQSATDPKAINGKEIADEIQNKIKEEVTLLKEKGVVPGLAVVLVGERKDSQTYVRMKKLAAEKAGMKFILKEIPENVSQEELLKVVQDLNADKEVHGFIVQMPLPKHIDEEKILDAIDHRKDVDGLHPLNAGMYYNNCNRLS
jgi:methylenetetrahydrofolate dehydrogenase (NADP+)/methenyltetrahydrofolate cyclohydrolase